MSPELLPRLCLCVSVCLYLFATCSARPNWHQGSTKQIDRTLYQDTSKKGKNSVTNIKYFKTLDSDRQGNVANQRYTRQAVNPFFSASFSLGGHSNIGHHHRQPFGTPIDSKYQHYGPPGGSPELHPIGQLASTLQNIIGSRLEAAVQHNHAVHFGTINHHDVRYPHPLSPCSLCTHHGQPFGESTHQVEIGSPHIISSGTGIQIEITCSEDDVGCSDHHKQIHPAKEKEKPFAKNTTVKEIPVTTPVPIKVTSTTAEQGELNHGGSDIVYGKDSKDSKTLGSDENEYGIDIRFGGGDSDMLPSKN